MHHPDVMAGLLDTCWWRWRPTSADGQPAAQHHVDAAASKTINLPVTATVDDSRATYRSGWKAKGEF